MHVPVHPPEELDGTGRATDQGGAQRAHVELFEVRMLELRDEHGRDAGNDRSFLLLDRLEHRPSVEGSPREDVAAPYVTQLSTLHTHPAQW